jgi:RNA polymerase sigma factor (sigma-70 family)
MLVPAVPGGGQHGRPQDESTPSRSGRDMDSSPTDNRPPPLQRDSFLVTSQPNRRLSPLSVQPPPEPQAEEWSRLLAAQAGDEESFCRLMELNETRLKAVIYRTSQERLRRIVPPEDLFNTVVMKSWTKLRDAVFPHLGAFHKWLDTLAENTVNAEHRRHCKTLKRAGASRSLGEDAGRSDSGTLLQLAAVLPSNDQSPSATVRLQESLTLLNEAVQALPSNYAMVIRLRLLEGLRSAEVATRMSITAEYERKLLERALKECAALLRRMGLRESEEG